MRRRSIALLDETELVLVSGRGGKVLYDCFDPALARLMALSGRNVLPGLLIAPNRISEASCEELELGWLPAVAGRSRVPSRKLCALPRLQAVSGLRTLAWSLSLSFPNFNPSLDPADVPATVSGRGTATEIGDSASEKSSAQPTRGSSPPASEVSQGDSRTPAAAAWKSAHSKARTPFRGRDESRIESGLSGRGSH
mmetsp:Transcript_10239/g.19353  ORF Transcript_10239/g.19353 Transcript_10239/m.19353 type:complete len:196 (-) Transcript_10239:846-1433(-)